MCKNERIQHHTTLTNNIYTDTLFMYQHDTINYLNGHSGRFGGLLNGVGVVGFVAKQLLHLRMIDF